MCEVEKFIEYVEYPDCSEDLPVKNEQYFGPIIRSTDTNTTVIV